MGRDPLLRLIARLQHAMQGRQPAIQPQLLRQGCQRLELSRQLVTPHWGWALLLAIVAGFVSGLGAIACGVGVLATLPLGWLMLEAAHQRVCVRPPA